MSAVLATAGFVAAEEEATGLIAFAQGETSALEASLARRLSGEPLAWITCVTRFCGLSVCVHPGGIPVSMCLDGRPSLNFGGDQAELPSGHLHVCGFDDIVLLVDEDDDVRGVEATYVS